MDPTHALTSRIPVYSDGSDPRPDQLNPSVMVVLRPMLTHVMSILTGETAVQPMTVASPRFT